MNILIFLGSVRQSTPPAPVRLGERVALSCKQHIERQFSALQVEVIDPLDFELGPIFKPHFSYTNTDVPLSLQTLAEKIEKADGYVMVSPEYNHSMSPALANLLNHFGSSLFSYKPSMIVTYSAGQWGGARAAVNMRTFLSELGCLPVSAMIHIPKAQEVLNENGDFSNEVNPEKWAGYYQRAFSQLHWWAMAAKRHHASKEGEQRPVAFKRNPAQRNAP